MRTEIALSIRERYKSWRGEMPLRSIAAMSLGSVPFEPAVGIGGGGAAERVGALSIPWTPACRRIKIAVSKRALHATQKDQRLSSWAQRAQTEAAGAYRPIRGKVPKVQAQATSAHEEIAEPPLVEVERWAVSSVMLAPAAEEAEEKAVQRRPRWMWRPVVFLSLAVPQEPPLLDHWHSPRTSSDP